MRAMVNRIGAKYGWSKQWSDAQSEWWHILYQAGHWSGPDPGPGGGGTPAPAPAPVQAAMSDHTTGMRWINSGMTPTGKLP
jgi:hypothetical protein